MGTGTGGDPAETPVRARTGAWFPPGQQLETFDEPESRHRWPEREPGARLPRFGEDVAAEDVNGPRVRPYVLTRGRTQATHELALETLVNVRADARWTGVALNSEYQPVRALCAHPVSVAEIAAKLSVPLGVVRVLLSDMAELGLLHIHGTARTAEGRPPMALMRRVLAGLQRI
ncbi:DUF742 domain-containing protein [Amycolatopsis pithecellobii]|uniref:DUF742 domain-containing protein n=1 Tax=Amycolatopsis pithecellobii TaxID=664692 RepID=A0A6N7Z824_9PSEU|nr:DUF742 domain-containing protein [Amycolatopsis pithecellobii]MTD57644.1 DUF742 domain-containing protein [Amycolatopsis pithecellobii]